MKVKEKSATYIKRELDNEFPLSVPAFDEKEGTATRMKLAREELGISQQEFADSFGGSKRGIQGNEAAIAEPGSAVIRAFSRLGINANWLLTGEGQMRLVSSEPVDGYAAIPLYNNVQAAAGAGALVGEEVADGFMRFSEEWLRVELGARLRDLCLIRATGDSMEPTFRSGDVLLVDRRATNPDREGIYIMRSGTSLLVKRLQLLPGRRVRVSSDNPLYQSYELLVSELSDDDVQVIGRVVWSGRRA